LSRFTQLQRALASVSNPDEELPQEPEARPPEDLRSIVENADWRAKQHQKEVDEHYDRLMKAGKATPAAEFKPRGSLNEEAPDTGVLPPEEPEMPTGAGSAVEATKVEVEARRSFSAALRANKYDALTSRLQSAPATPQIPPTTPPLSADGLTPEQEAPFEEFEARTESADDRRRSEGKQGDWVNHSGFTRILGSLMEWGPDVSFEDLQRLSADSTEAINEVYKMHPVYRQLMSGPSEQFIGWMREGLPESIPEPVREAMDSARDRAPAYLDDVTTPREGEVDIHRELVSFDAVPNAYAVGTNLIVSSERHRMHHYYEAVRIHEEKHGRAPTVSEREQFAMEAADYAKRVQARLKGGADRAGLAIVDVDPEGTNEYLRSLPAGRRLLEANIRQTSGTVLIGGHLWQQKDLTTSTFGGTEYVMNLVSQMFDPIVGGAVSNETFGKDDLLDLIAPAATPGHMWAPPYESALTAPLPSHRTARVLVDAVTPDFDTPLPFDLKSDAALDGIRRGEDIITQYDKLGGRFARWAMSNPLRRKIIEATLFHSFDGELQPQQQFFLGDEATTTDALGYWLTGTAALWEFDAMGMIGLAGKAASAIARTAKATHYARGAEQAASGLK